jgi:hypothetical protein
MYMFLRLYKSVDEYDVLLGIFTNKIGTQEVTKKAVEAESRCDYQKARAYYEEVYCNVMYFQILKNQNNI